MNREWILAVLVFLPFVAGLLAYRAERRKDIWVVGTSVLEFLLMAGIAMGASGWQGMEPAVECFLPKVCGMGLYFVLDGFRLVYGCVAVFMWLTASVLSQEYFAGKKRQGRFWLFWLWTFGAVMGVFLSGDLYTTFLFFEILSFTSYVWVVQEEKKASLQAGAVYLAVSVAGGLVMLMGIFLLYHQLGTLRLAELRAAASACAERKMLYAAGGCLFFGFGAKAGVFPLHIWLPQAHPAAPAPASALLSGILTKTGIYGILAVSCKLFYHDISWGGMVLAFGTVTMLGGAVLALFSLDLKRTLACSSMSQAGFILVGIGMQGLLGEKNALAVQGTVLHMINHSLVKLVLFLAAGVIYCSAHSLDLNRIRGFGRRKPLLAGIFLTGALCLGGVPGFGGYISKTLLHESILEYSGGLGKTVEAAFLLSGGLTVAYMAKLFGAVFVEKNRDEEIQRKYDDRRVYMGTGSRAALTAAAGALLIWGLFPHRIMDRAAGLAQGFMGLEEAGERAAYFSPESLRGGMISIGIGVLVYALFVRKVLMKREGKAVTGRSSKTVYVDRWPGWLDLEKIVYRPLLKVLFGFFSVSCRILDCFVDGTVVVLRRSLFRDSALPYERPEGNFLTAWLGRMLNRIQRLGNHIWHRGAPRDRDYVHLAAARYDEARENSLLIQRSLSFGLLLFALGLVLTLAYLILW